MSQNIEEVELGRAFLAVAELDDDERGELKAGHVAVDIETDEIVRLVGTPEEFARFAAKLVPLAVAAKFEAEEGPDDDEGAPRPATAGAS